MSVGTGSRSAYRDPGLSLRDLGLPGALLVLSYPFFRIASAFLHERRMVLPFALLMAVITYGVVVNVIEDSLLSFIFALCIATGFSASDMREIGRDSR